jgi:hypothetical protein
MRYRFDWDGVTICCPNDRRLLHLIPALPYIIGSMFTRVYLPGSLLLHLTETAILVSK